MTNAELVARTEVIKKETKIAHAETEKILIPQLKNIQSKDDYARILQMFYGYFTPLQSRIEKFIDDRNLPDINERRKVAAIETDLFSLGVKEKPDICTQLPAIHHPLQALGALYVIEGSTLGGAIIAKMLQNNTALQATDAMLNFFKGYGEDTMQMWQAFKSFLENKIETDDDLAQVIVAANETFVKLKAWMLNYN